MIWITAYWTASILTMALIVATAPEGFETEEGYFEGVE